MKKENKKWKKNFYESQAWIIILFFPVMLLFIEIIPDDLLFFIYVLGVIVGFVFFIFMLIEAAKLKRWGWFVANLLLGSIIHLIFYFKYIRKELKK